MSKVIDVFGTWCGPCKVYKPIFESVSKMDEFKNIEFQELNADENEDLVTEYGIRGVPTTIFLNDNGEVVGKLVGLQTEGALSGKIKELFPGV